MNNAASLIVALLVGSILGGLVVNNHHVKGRNLRELQRYEAQEERNAAIGRLSSEYYQKYQDAINRPADVVERRVYVKAGCVPAGPTPGMGDAADAGGRSVDSGVAGSTGKVALAPATVDAVVAVADKHQRLYDMCRAKLEYLQHAYSNQQ